MNTTSSTAKKRHKTTRMVTAAVLTAGLLLPGTAAIGVEGAHAAAAAASQTSAVKSVKVTWNGKAVGASALQIGGNTYVPVKALAKASGLSLRYDKSTTQYTLGTSPNPLHLSSYENKVWIGAGGVSLESEGRVIGGSMYIPFSALRDYGGIDGSWSAKTGTLALKPTASKGVKITAKTIKSKEGTTDISIRYPQVSGSEAGIAAINKKLKSHADNALAEFKQQIKKQDPSIGNGNYEAQSDYTVAYNKDGVLSLVLQDYVYYGGAHGGTFQTGYTFSLNSGKEIELDTLLKANPNYRGEIDKQIAKEFAKEETGVFDTFKTIGSDPDFYVKNGGIVIFFQQYEYTAYAAGIPAFDFTFASLLPKGANPFSGL
ncbi:DUF4163 domain-containing protein [Saccharibacillus sp. CPCC 101409]|uniref:PdaC/SigV domain-containing protein n=1 Tax=Saccharibacillus sp. CPCC 101409 TaxID=3058041 RepID=UPI0026736B82|nr:DUF4163 domain-containing protein [Saccharibacillus sp. CPCC 101409]MDO3413103.1 DUF4163 domain-containing protein [Saccharibacillus sp. CPCC 101409]